MCMCACVSVIGFVYVCAYVLWLSYWCVAVSVGDWYAIGCALELVYAFLSAHVLVLVSVCVLVTILENVLGLY